MWPPSHHENGFVANQALGHILYVIYTIYIKCPLYAHIYNEHTFSKRGKFIIIEQPQNINTIPTETLKLRLRERENFWIKKLKTLTPYCLNKELN